MSELEKKPENTAPTSAEAPAEKPAGKAAEKKANTKIRLFVELGVLVLAVVVVCIVGEAKKLQWWCHLRAKLGSTKMQYELGKYYANAEKPAKDKALYWLRKAAAKGHPAAAAAAADATGDNAAKIKWLLSAAEKGNAKIQFKLAQIYRADEKMTEAVKWYEKAAAKGVKEAMHNLATCYLDGIGVEKDLVKAKALYEKAAKAGYGPSEAKLQEVEEALKKAEK